MNFHNSVRAYAVRQAVESVKDSLLRLENDGEISSLLTLRTMSNIAGEIDINELGDPEFFPGLPADADDPDYVSSYNEFWNEVHIAVDAWLSGLKPASRPKKTRNPRMRRDGRG